MLRFILRFFSLGQSGTAFGGEQLAGDGGQQDDDVFYDTQEQPDAEQPDVHQRQSGAPDDIPGDGERFPLEHFTEHRDLACIETARATAMAVEGTVWSDGSITELRQPISASRSCVRINLLELNEQKWHIKSPTFQNLADRAQNSFITVRVPVTKAGENGSEHTTYYTLNIQLKPTAKTKVRIDGQDINVKVVHEDKVMEAHIIFTSKTYPANYFENYSIAWLNVLQEKAVKAKQFVNDASLCFALSQRLNSISNKLGLGNQNKLLASIAPYHQLLQFVFQQLIQYKSKEDFGIAVSKLCAQWFIDSYALASLKPYLPTRLYAPTQTVLSLFWDALWYNDTKYLAAIASYKLLHLLVKCIPENWVLFGDIVGLAGVAASLRLTVNYSAKSGYLGKLLTIATTIDTLIHPRVLKAIHWMTGTTMDATYTDLVHGIPNDLKLLWNILLRVEHVFTNSDLLCNIINKVLDYLTTRQDAINKFVSDFSHDRQGGGVRFSHLDKATVNSMSIAFNEVSTDLFYTIELLKEWLAMLNSGKSTSIMEVIEGAILKIPIYGVYEDSKKQQAKMACYKKLKEFISHIDKDQSQLGSGVGPLPKAGVDCDNGLIKCFLPHESNGFQFWKDVGDSDDGSHNPLTDTHARPVECES